MNEARRRREIFTQALATPPPERNAFLDSACGADAKLREEVEHLLLAYQRESNADSAKNPRSTRAKGKPIPPRLKQALRHNYTIQERIGGGGMGDLYLATHKALGGKWAIKVLAEDLAKDQHVVERFINEAKIEANLRHPNVVTVFNIGHSGGFHYFVMNYVEGEDLAERIAGRGKLPQSEAISITFQICKALECAHDHNIIHRDLKPSNVRIDRYGTVVVIDFGIARARDVAMGNITIEGERLGTPLYMSPELIKGGSADVRSDLYALGVLFYEMLAGENPFQAGTLHSVYARHVYFTPPPVTEVCPGVSPETSEIILKLLDKDPEKRFQSVRELTARLQPLRELTEISPPAETESRRRHDAQDAVKRLEHVVLKVPATVISRELSEDERKVMELTNGTRTVGEMLALSNCDRERFFAALESLKQEKAIETLAHQAPPAFPSPPPLQQPPQPVTGMRQHLTRKRVVQVSIGLAACVIVGIVAYLLRPGSPPSTLAVRFDASPGATVSLKSGEREIVRETPFLIELPPGRYPAEFRLGSERRLREVVVGEGPPLLIREDFWGTKSRNAIDELLKHYLECRE